MNKKTQIEKLKQSIENHLSQARKAITPKARDAWMILADQDALQLANLTGWFTKERQKQTKN